MELDPVEYVIIEFPGNRFTGEIAPAIAALVDRGLVHIIDLVFVRKDADGSVTYFEYDDLDELAGFAEIDGETDGLLDVEGLDASGVRAWWARRRGLPWSPERPPLCRAGWPPGNTARPRNRRPPGRQRLWRRRPLTWRRPPAPLRAPSPTRSSTSSGSWASCATPVSSPMRSSPRRRRASSVSDLAPNLSAADPRLPFPVSPGAAVGPGAALARCVRLAARIVFDQNGPWRNRTSNLGIKSPLLCQLS
jgi:hypothetical protein